MDKPTLTIAMDNGGYYDNIVSYSLNQMDTFAVETASTVEGKQKYASWLLDQIFHSTTGTHMIATANTGKVYIISKQHISGITIA